MLNPGTTHSSSNRHCVGLLITTLITVFCGLPALADDTEVFFGSGTGQGANVLLVLDTSGSMATVDIPAPVAAYNPSGSYSASGCSSGRIYYKSASSTSAISCSSDYIDSSYFYCNDATASGGALASNGAGIYTDAAIRWKTTTSGGGGGGMGGIGGGTTTYAWNASLSGDYTSTPVACKGHSDDVGDTQFPTTGNTSTSTNYWSGTSGSNYWSSGTQTSYKFYSAHYVAYVVSSGASNVSRISAAKTAANAVLNDLYTNNSDVNVGLMIYDSNTSGESNGAEGGMIIEPVQPLDSTGLTTLTTAINGLKTGGNTPLSEALYESYLYFKGGSVLYGDMSETCTVNSGSTCSSGNLATQLSVASSRTGNTLSSHTYKSPADSACIKNYIVYLTDGQANEDDQSNSAISSLTGTSCSGDGGCLDELSGYMHSNDLRSTVSGNQNVTINYIAYGNDVDASYLGAAATAGGGNAYPATSYTALYDTLTGLLNQASDDPSTFTSPSVAVNSFNKTQVLEDMYVAIFKPSVNTRWPGNAKKYKFIDGVITDKNGSAAVDDDSGFFANSAQDYWSSLGSSTYSTLASATDFNFVTIGGAANKLPAPSARNLYTYVGGNPSVGSPVDLTLPAQAVKTSNTAITWNSVSILDNTGGSDPSTDTLVNWARGTDGTTDDATQRYEMGDIIHSQPAVVIYGNTGSTTVAKLNDAVVFAATNDGYLHSIDVTTGVERWAFIPQNLLGDLKNLYADLESSDKHYSLDGDIRVFKYDVDGDGVVDTSDGDRVILYFSQGRGGEYYYALDVTNKDTPKFMWQIGSSTLSKVNKSWSKPVIGRVKVGTGSGQNSQRYVLIFGGGYDTAEETTTYLGADSNGNAIYIVDAITGSVLWSASNSGASLDLADMNYAIPSNITIIDTDNDGFTDRMYVGDMGGQLWRFDITNGGIANSTTNPLVTGGVIASLGRAEDSTIASNRRFYNAPDITAFSAKGSSSYFNISIGSGYRGHPLNNATADRFYAIRDYKPYTKMTQTQYNNYSAVTDSALTDDITNSVYSGTAVTISSNSPGWKLILNGAGEKVLASSITVDGTVMFTSYLPSTTVSACSAAAGSGRAYAINVVDGTNHFEDAYEAFDTNGIPPAIQVISLDSIISTTDPGSSSSSTSSGGGSSSSSSSSTSSGSSSSSSSNPIAPPSGACQTGLKTLDQCVDFGSKVRTFWQETGAN